MFVGLQLVAAAGRSGIPPGNRQIAGVVDSYLLFMRCCYGRRGRLDISRHASCSVVTAKE